MASFDVESLFTNVPLNETIQICIEQLYSPDRPSLPMQNGLVISQHDFELMLHTAVKDVPFLFDGKYYKQVDGVSMGSPLGPTLANAFLCHHEKSWLQDCPPEYKPIMYQRYVDDTFLLFRSREHAALFLNYLNGKHPNIRFTCDTETNGVLNFLDLNICSAGGQFTTNVYRKPTFTGLYLQADSFLPENYKLGLINTLLNRAFRLCSSWQGFHKEVEFLRNILRQNGFTMAAFDRCLTSFLDKLHSAPPPKAETVPKKSVLLVLPYAGYLSKHVKQNITTLCARFLPQIDVRIVFKPSNRLSMMFLFKDRYPKCLRSGIVYKYKCSKCNLAYIGQSMRHLPIRVAEHTGISALTGNSVAPPKNSPVYNHAFNDQGVQICEKPRHEDFTVVTTSQNDFHLQVLESLAIKRDDPRLNNDWRVDRTANRSKSSVPLLLFQ